MTASRSSEAGSRGLLNVICTGSPGRHRPRPGQLAPFTASGAKVRVSNVDASSLTLGPSAEGVPGPISTVTSLSPGNGRSGVNATQCSSSAASVILLASSSSAISSSVAKRSSASSPPARNVVTASTSAGSMRWSKKATSTGWRPMTSGAENDCTRGGGVAKLQRTASARVAPFAASVPAGTSTV